jgi:ArsR family transcriptional regulator
MPTHQTMPSGIDTKFTQPLEPLDADAFAGICKALGHPARIAIVEHLLDGNTCICGDLVSLLPLAQSTVSQHLAQLKTCGLIMGEIDGPRTCYCIDRHVFDRFRATVAHMTGQGIQDDQDKK